MELSKYSNLLYFSKFRIFFFVENGNFLYFENKSEFEYLDNCIRFSGYKLPRIRGRRFLIAQWLSAKSRYASTGSYLG